MVRNLMRNMHKSNNIYASFLGEKMETFPQNNPPMIRNSNFHREKESRNEKNVILSKNSLQLLEAHSI